MQIEAAGMPWFAEDDYESFRRVLPDRSWHPTHAQWLDAAEKNLERLKASGVLAVKAHVRSNDFITWCRSTGRNVDAKALAAWGNEAAIREYTKIHGN